nr:MAG TPA: integrase [Caudoviricetes sp.]
MAYRKEQDTIGLRAAFYARVSTAEEEQLNAIELQIEENRNAIERHKWKKVDEYIDRSKSGTMVKGRDEYQRLFDDLYSDKFDVVVIKDQERLMRNTLDWYLFINRLVSTGKILYMYMEDRFYSPDDALITGIKAIIAEEFSRNLSKKLRNYHAGRVAKAREGKEIDLQGSGNVFGWDKKEGRYILNPEQAKIRRLMCEGIMARKGSTQIAKELNDAGYRNTVGKKWKPMDIPKFVYDCKNVGTMIINKERHDFESKKTIKLPESEWVYVKNALPPIVTEEEWALICKIHEERVIATGCNKRGKKTTGFSFSGKIYCGLCDAPYWRKQRVSKEEYWVCSTKQTKGRKTRARDAVGGKAGEFNAEGCDNENISYGALMAIMELVSERLKADTGVIKEFMIERLNGYKKRITEANRGATEADLQRELDRKDRLLDAYLDHILTKEEYQRKALALDEKIMELKREVTANRGNLEDLNEIDRVLANIDAEVAKYLDDNSQLKVEYLLEHLEKVVIYPDKAVVIIPILCEGFVVDKAQYVSREKSTEIQTESNVIYLADVRYWNRDIELYVQFVAA